MSAYEPVELVPGSLLDELSERGDAIYAGLRDQLEPEKNGRYVAIHVDTGDYVVARTSGDAMRALLQRHGADGRMYLRRIGNEPEYNLAIRLFGPEVFAAGPK